MNRTIFLVIPLLVVFFSRAAAAAEDPNALFQACAYISEIPSPTSNGASLSTSRPISQREIPFQRVRASTRLWIFHTTAATASIAEAGMRAINPPCSRCLACANLLRSEASMTDAAVHHLMFDSTLKLKAGTAHNDRSGTPGYYAFTTALTRVDAAGVLLAVLQHPPATVDLARSLRLIFCISNTYLVINKLLVNDTPIDRASKS